MNLYSNAIEDERVRRYLPVNRVMAGENFSGAEAVVNNPEVQLFLWGKTKPECTIQPGGWILVDFGIELHGGVRLLSREAGKIRLRFGESAGEAMQEPNQDHAVHDTELLLPRNGMIEYGNTAFRFARIDSLEPEKNLAFQNILAVALYRELEWTGSFESSDERLNHIWKTGAYTVLLNMQDYIYDGAKRDRLPWMGDLNPELRTILAVFSDTSLVRRTLDYLKKQTPLPGWMNGIVTYSLWFIISHWEYYRHTGDRNYLAAQKEYIDELLKHFAGMIAPGGAEQIVGRRFLDWPNNDNPQGLHAGLHGLLYWAFRCGLNICRSLETDTLLCRTALEKLRGYIPDCGECKAAAAIMTISGLSDCSQVLFRDPFRGLSTFYGCYMLYAQPTPNALEVIRRYWGGMLDYGATTFWEDFDLDWLENTSPISELPVRGRNDLHADFGAYCYKGLRHSLCHGWASGPTSFLSRRIAGIRFLEPGGGTISISPDLCDLEYAAVRYPTPHGPVTVTAEKGKKPEIKAPPEVEIIESPQRT